MGSLLYIIHSSTAYITTSVEGISREATTPGSNLLKNRYVMLIFALVTGWWMTYFFIENNFYDRVAAQFSDEEQLAGIAILAIFFL